MVKFFPKQKAVCTCPAYRYSGGYDEQSCKHIKLVKAAGCFYMPYYQDMEANLRAIGKNDLVHAHIAIHSTTEQDRSEIHCPGCDQPMLEVTI